MEALNTDKGSTVSLLPSPSTEGKAAAPDTTPKIKLKPGMTLCGRFILVEKIAEGGTSDIYSAIDKIISVSSKNSHPVALKIAKGSTKSLRQLTVNEALVSRLVSHPNIAKVHSYHRDQGLDFVSMELVSGETLSNILSRAPKQRLTYRHTLSIIKPVCDALAAMHEQNTIHSDIKPSNILISDSGSIKVIDLATARDSSTSSRPSDIHGISYYGYTLGYASPETIADKPASAGDDIFSVGCIIYEMLTGKHPYGRKASNKIEPNIIIERPKSLNVLQWTILKKAIHLEGKKRFSSISRFISLFSLAGKVKRYATAAVGVLALIGIGAFALSSPSEPQWTIEDEQQITNQQIHLIKNTDITLMPEALAKLNGDLLDMGGLRMLQDNVTRRTLELVQAKLRNNQDETIDFASLDELVNKLTLIYPDSIKLDRAASNISLKKQSLREMSMRNYREFWDNTSFSKADSKTVNTLLDKLSTLGVTNNDISRLTPTASVEQLKRLVLEAKTAYNYKKVAEIAHFSDNPALPAFFKQNIDNNTQQIMQGAKQLASFTKSDSQGLGAQAQKHFIGPFVQATEKAVNIAWSDKDLIAAKAAMDVGISRLGLAKHHKAHQDVTQALAKKVAFKMNFHRESGNRSSALKLQQLLKDQ